MAQRYRPTDENAQVAAYLVHAASAGCAFIDRALYLPPSGPMIRPGAEPRGSPGDPPGLDVRD
jgi:hypothetical protein